MIAGKGVNKWIIGWGMVPRGEVGLIFASVGRALGVVDAAEFSVIVVVIMLTTFITPPVLGYLLKKNPIS
jgi:Kef-type K+ transport system membrane component KefB